MGAKMDQMKMITKAARLMKELKKEEFKVEDGDGAVRIDFGFDGKTGMPKVNKITLNKDKIDFDDMPELERWLESCIRDGYAHATELSKEKLEPLMGSLGDLGGFGM